MSYTDQIFEFAKASTPDLYWLTVIEDGVSQTRQISPSNQTNNCYSVSKAFTVTALGMLFDEGKLSVDEKIVDIFKDELIPDMDEKWQEVTVDMVMRHRYGIARGYLDIDAEPVGEFERLYGSRDDFLKIVFSAKLPKVLGTDFCYSDAAYYLLSRVCQKKSGEDLYDYLRTRLFNPMHFEEAAWTKCPQGYSMGATGLYIRSADIAKLAQLYLQKGVYNGQRLLSQAWCETVFERGYELGRCADGIYAKGGMCGQMVCLDQKKGLAIGWLGYETQGGSGKMLNYLKNL